MGRFEVLFSAGKSDDSFKWINQKCELYMDVSENSGTPKSSILIGFSIKPSILGYPYFWKHPYVPIMKTEKKNCSIKLTNLLFNSLSKFEQVNLRQISEAVEIRWLLHVHFESIFLFVFCNKSLLAQIISYKWNLVNVSQGLASLTKCRWMIEYLHVSMTWHGLSMMFHKILVGSPRNGAPGQGEFSNYFSFLSRLVKYI